MATAPQAAWETNFSRKLHTLSVDRENADVCIRLGSNEILAHKFILDVNCELLKTEDVAYNTKKKILEVFLDKEFEDSVDLVEGIVEGFYTGVVTVSDENLKLTYKFAKLYSVEWLMEFLLQMFQNALKESETNFADIYCFADTLGCETLKTLCLEHMNFGLVDALIQSGDLLKMDYRFIKRCALLDNPGLPEITLFQMVSKWYEHDIVNRQHHAEQLLPKVRFQRIHKDDINAVQDWIMNATGIEDKVRLQLLGAVNRSVNQPSNGKTELSNAELSAQPVKKDVATILKLIQEYIDKKGTDEENKCIHITSEEFLRASRERFTGSSPYLQQCILEYLSDKLGTLINKDNLAEFIKLPGFETSVALTRLIKKSSKYASNVQELLWDWEELPYDTLFKILSATVNWGNNEQWKRAIAGVMEWGRHHPEQVSKLPHLLSNAVCCCAIPEQYKTMVLIPHLQKLMNNDAYELANCEVHKGQKGPSCGINANVRVAPFSEDLYMLKHGSYVNIPNSNNTNRRLTLNISRSPGPLNVHPTHTTTALEFLVFDTEQCMERYPVFSKGENLTLQDIRRLLIKYKNLQVMVFC